jgi:hypothetical protein
MNGTATYGDRVVIVEVQSGRVQLTTGCVSSSPQDPPDPDKLDKMVVRGDRRLRTMAESPEAAYAREFKVDDIHLLKEEEAQALQDPARAQAWFGSIYQDRLVSKIHRALKRLKR